MSNNTGDHNIPEPVLIVGAKGMLGSMFLSLLTLEKISVHGVDVDLLDITRSEQVDDFFSRRRFALIINCAAYTNVDGAEDDGAAARKVNVDGIRHLALAAKRLNARLVHFSTDYVFSGIQHDYREDDMAQPINAYGQSKRDGELSLQDVGGDWLLIRTAWLYGPNGKNFVDTVRAKLTAGEELKVVNDQIGSPTFTGDLAQAVISLLKDNAVSGIYHLTNSGHTSWYELACAIRDILGLNALISPVTTSAVPRKARRPAYSVLINTKRPPLPGWRDALTRYLIQP